MAVIILWIAAAMFLILAMAFTDHGAEVNNPPSTIAGLAFGVLALLAAHLA